MKIELQQSKTHGTSKAISGWNVIAINLYIKKVELLQIDT
jgi:hypothetical protein